MAAHLFDCLAFALRTIRILQQTTQGSLSHAINNKSINWTNDDMRMSRAGYAALRVNEGVVLRYYNDAPADGNCTWGVGTLAHLGPCTEEELHRTVTTDQVDAILRVRVHDAERIVKTTVKLHRLTQAQFDAAVSFAYNSPRQNTRVALNPANRGNMRAVASHMARNVLITPRDRTGRPLGPARRSQGLVNRRRRESAPFRATRESRQ